MIELNNKMSHAELVAYFAAAQKMLSDLMIKVKAKEAAKKKVGKVRISNRLTSNFQSSSE
jgi:hypothetical protein